MYELIRVFFLISGVDGRKKWEINSKKSISDINESKHLSENSQIWF